MRVSIRENSDRILESLNHINEATPKDKYNEVDDILHDGKLKNFFVNHNLIDDFFDFMNKWENVKNAYYQDNLKNLEPKPFKYMIGKKFIKIFRDGSVSAFVDNCGNVYKPASWNKPADGVRYYLDEYENIKFDTFGSFLYGNRNLKKRTERDF